ncbi:MAG: extracellular solute-binding protein [Clostridiales bacterium]|nr:extracellular solute-binding protein [Clostridiales bacterium]
MKKLLAILIVLCMLPAIALAGVSQPGVYPITDEDVTLNVWVVRTPQTDEPDKMAQSIWYEEFSGVKVNWISVPLDEMDTMFNLAVAGDNLPDIFLYAVDSGELMNLAEDGIVLPLDDLIKEHGYYYPKMLDELDMWDAVTAPDGHIYSFLSSVYLVQNSMFNKVWVLRDWLAAYNASINLPADTMPQTLDEFEKMLLYFRDNDMNGNGDPSDEIPLMGNNQLVSEGTDPMFYFINSFLYCPNNFLVADKDHNVSMAVTQDAFRESLKFMNKLYTQGLLSEETFVQNLTQMRQITSVYKESAVAGVVAGMNPMRVVNVSSEEGKVSYGDYVAVPPVAGPEGVRLTARRAESQLNLRCFITTSCKNPDVAYKWLDYWCSKEGSLWSSFLGQENVHWAWADEPSFGGDAKSVKSLVDWTSPQSVYWTITWFADYYITQDMFYAKAASRTYSDNELAGSLAEQTYMPYAVMTEFPQISWCADSDLVTEKAELDVQFRDFILNNCTKFILGTRDIQSDAEWTAFQNELNNMGLAHYLEVVRNYYWAE